MTQSEKGFWCALRLRIAAGRDSEAIPVIASGLGVSAVSGRTCPKPVPALFRRRLRERVVGGRVRGTARMGSRYELHAHCHTGAIAGPVVASAGQLFLL